MYETKTYFGVTTIELLCNTHKTAYYKAYAAAMPKVNQH